METSNQIPTTKQTKIHYAQDRDPPENNGQRRPQKRTPEYKDEIQEGNTRKMLNGGYIQITKHPYVIKNTKYRDQKRRRKTIRENSRNMDTYAFYKTNGTIAN